jgi:hypothetical protein
MDNRTPDVFVRNICTCSKRSNLVSRQIKIIPYKVSVPPPKGEYPSKYKPFAFRLSICRGETPPVLADMDVPKDPNMELINNIWDKE